MSLDDLMDVRKAINLQLVALHQNAELGDREAAPRADGLRSAAMVVDRLVQTRYPEIWLTHEARPEEISLLRRSRDVIARLLVQHSIQDNDALDVVNEVSRLIDRETGGEG